MEESKKHPIVSTSFSSLAHSTLTNNVSMMHQWPNSEMKASTSSVNATGNHFTRDASGITQPRMDRPQFKSDMHTGASQGPEEKEVNNTATNVIVISDETDAEFDNPPRESKISPQQSLDRNQEEEVRNRANENQALGEIFTPRSANHPPPFSASSPSSSSSSSSSDGYDVMVQLPANWPDLAIQKAPANKP